MTGIQPTPRTSGMTVPQSMGLARVDDAKAALEDAAELMSEAGPFLRRIIREIDTFEYEQPRGRR